MNNKTLTVIVNRKKISVPIYSIMYISASVNDCYIHMVRGRVYRTRMKLDTIQELVGDDFIRVHRSNLVCIRAIHDISDKLILSNGETLNYATRRKTAIRNLLYEKQQKMIRGFESEVSLKSAAEYAEFYKSYDEMPFAYTDIEMVFNENYHAVDWIFRYGNEKLAEIEKVSLDELIGKSFGSIFKNMDSKWLNCYERATLYGETLELMDYSPEIDKYLKIICFPTFPGHCGCMLYDLEEIQFVKSSDETDKTLEMYYGKME